MPLESSTFRIRQPSRVHLRLAIFSSSLLLSVISHAAQLPLITSSRSPEVVPGVITGSVVDAVSGLPLPRVLVEINNRAMLTDQQGRFHFDQPGQPVSNLRLKKPGYSSAPEQMDSASIAAGVPARADSLTLLLWPEALLTGRAVAPDGEPLQRLSVIARRNVFDEQGHHSQIAGQTQTDSHGAFRIPVTAGDYVVETQFSPRGFEREEAILPYVFPPDFEVGSGEVLHLTSGDVKQVELHPIVSKTHAVTLSLEDGAEGQPPRVTARSSTGVTFSAGGFRAQEPGSVRLNLPNGTYSLHATRYSRDGMQFGESNVTVADRDVVGSALHLAALPGIPINLVADVSTAQASISSGGGRSETSLPTSMQFNLVLEPVELDSTSPYQFGVRPSQQRDGTASFAAPPGSYRLSAGVAAGWYIRSATSRGSDLLREALTISPGSSPSPITLLLSNQVGSLQGNVSLSGAPAACWIYLIASGPSLPKVIIQRSGANGGFHITDLPPGSYRAVALPYRHSANFEDPSILEQYGSHVGAVSVEAGSAATLDLDAVTLKEMVP